MSENIPVQPVTTNQQPKPKRPRKSGKSVFTKILVALVVLALIGGLAYLFKEYRDTQAEVQKLSTVQGQQELNKTQTQALLGEMRSIILLPEGEDPVVATITDINQLKDKEFYKDAQNNDRVIVYANAKKAYIYRPESKLIVNVGSFQLDQSAQQQAQTPVTR